MPTKAINLAKRGIDIVSSAIGLGLTLPLYPIIAAAIRIESPGPIFYGQRRAGMLRAHASSDRSREPLSDEFTMYKFRSMRADAERGTGAVLAAKNDPRVTRVGKFLRKSRLDELPQLWSVLKGEMSLVGPRPERPELLRDLALAIPFFEERMRGVKPGITGLAQVSLGYTGAIPDHSELAAFREAITNPFKFEEAEGALADDMRAKLLYDLAYTASLEDFSSFIRMEMTVILKTPLIMLKGVGR